MVAKVAELYYFCQKHLKLNFKIEEKKNLIILRCVSDKLDSFTSSELKTLFLHHSNNGCKNFIIDLSLAKYCDSSGLSALLVGNRIIKEKEGSLNIFGLNPMVKKIISISQLDTVFNISNNEETALKNIS
ncbi:MAG: anti-anti-sigma factor [Crocinitomicaceae bacterium]|nr:anti-anti-sigma factor [Crocinitomicaceae bacterium]